MTDCTKCVNYGPVACQSVPPGTSCKAFKLDPTLSNVGTTYRERAYRSCKYFDNTYKGCIRNGTYQVCGLMTGTMMCHDIPYSKDLKVGAKDLSSPGAKDDAEKLDPTLVPGFHVTELAKLFTVGAKKYSRDAWKSVENGEARYTAAAYRHMLRHMDGEIIDPEMGLPHLLAVAWNCLAVLWFKKHKKK